MLLQCIYHSENSRQHASCEDQHPPPDFARIERIGGEADQAVYGHLYHDSGHQGGYVGRACGVRVWEPFVEGYCPGFDAESDK